MSQILIYLTFIFIAPASAEVVIAQGSETFPNNTVASVLQTTETTGNDFDQSIDNDHDVILTQSRANDYSPDQVMLDNQFTPLSKTISSDYSIRAPPIAA